MKDYHQILEVPPDATEEQLRAQYRRLVRIYHPDRFNNPQDKEYVEQKFKEISEAYQILLSRLKGSDSTGQSSLGNPADAIPPKPVAIPSVLDFGEIVKGEQRTLRFQVHNDGGIARNLQLNYSDEHHWFKVMNGRKVHQSRPFPMEFTVVVDTSRLQAGKTYHGWIQVEIDHTYIQLTLAAKVSARRIWNILTPRYALILSLFLFLLLITQRQWSNLGLPIFSQSLKPLPTVQVSVYSTTPLALNSDSTKTLSENSITLGNTTVSSTTTVRGTETVLPATKEFPSIASLPLVATITATSTTLFSTLVTDTTLITDIAEISLTTSSIFAVGSPPTVTVQTQTDSAEILNISGRTKAQASATAEFLLPPVESMRLTVTSSPSGNFDGQETLEGSPNSSRDSVRDNDLRPAVEAAKFDAADNVDSSAVMSATATPTATATNTPPPTATATREPTVTPTQRPTTTAANTPTPTASMTATEAQEATVTSTPRPTATATSTPTPMVAVTATLEPTATSTRRPTATATSTLTATLEPTATSTQRPTATATSTPTPTVAVTVTATSTQRPTVTATSTPTPTVAVTATQEPTATSTRRPTATATSTPTPIALATATLIPRSTVTVTVLEEPSDRLVVATVVIPDTYNVNARSQTSVTSDVLAVLQSGTEWTAIGRTIDGAWLLIVLSDGQYAWVFTTTVIVDVEMLNQLRITNTIPNS